MKKLFYIDYPQEHVEGQAHTYRCVYCKLITTRINGKLDGHLPTCEYRLKMEQSGYNAQANVEFLDSPMADEVD
jgi:hypothetical protein